MAGKSVWFLAPALAGVALMAASSAGAQETTVRIVRMSLATGAVQVQLPDAKGWRPAMFQAPLQQGESIRTLASGRAEIQFENGSTLRLIPGSEVELSKMLLSEQGKFTTWVAVNSGTAFLTLRKQDTGFRLLLPKGAAVRPDGDLTCRVDTGAATAVTVYEGHASVEEDGRAVDVNKNRVATLGKAVAVADLTAAADPWTQWSHVRDEYFAKAIHNGVQSGSLISYASWYGGTGAQPTYYTGTNLSYSGAEACPWTVTSGDYKGWCWSTAQGWFLPETAVASNAEANAQNSATEVSQTNTILGVGMAGSAPVVANPDGVTCEDGNGMPILLPICMGFGFGFGDYADTGYYTYNLAPGYYLPGAGGSTGKQFGRVVGPTPGHGNGLVRLGPPPRVMAGFTARRGFAGVRATGFSHEGIQASRVNAGRMVMAGIRGGTTMRSGLGAGSAPAFAGAGMPSFARASATGMAAAHVGGSVSAAPAGGLMGGGVSHGAVGSAAGRTPH